LGSFGDKASRAAGRPQRTNGLRRPAGPAQVSHVLTGGGKRPRSLCHRNPPHINYGRMTG
jgi:hypothetical protein